MKLRIVNRCLVVAIIIVNAYIVVTPFVPGLLFWVQKHNTQKVAQLNRRIHEPAPMPTTPAVNHDNQLVIPAMLFDGPVFEGTTMSTLNKGAWRVPYTSTPDKGGNTVIIGHRFTYTSPKGTFYHLDQVHAGDEIGLFWNDKKYIYKVRATKEVPPTATEVEAPTADPILTLYTCTPLWNPKDRLVVVADLVP